ncbi:MAG: glycosyltransferase [Nitrospirae bacterium]|nr:glycosyltransferase [Nitrospirota bacterium]
MTGPGKHPLVSVIVPVYNDAGRIGKCIGALMSQTYPGDRTEIIIVDNGSTDNTREVVERHPVVMLREDGIRSSYAARNRGVINAKGEILAFTDADCIPHADWLEKGVARMQDIPGCGLIAGRINLFFQKPDQPNAVELYESKMIFRQKENIERHRYGATANVFTYKEVFNRVGLFNCEMKSGGDNEWGLRVYVGGYVQVYADDVCVAHPARHSIVQLYRRTARLVGGKHDKYGKYAYSTSELIKNLAHSFKTIVARIIGTSFNLFPDKSVNGIRQKLSIIYISILIEIFRNIERMRLFIWGQSRR